MHCISYESWENCCTNALLLKENILIIKSTIKEICYLKSKINIRRIKIWYNFIQNKSKYIRKWSTPGRKLLKKKVQPLKKPHQNWRESLDARDSLNPEFSDRPSPGLTFRGKFRKIDGCTTWGFVRPAFPAEQPPRAVTDVSLRRRRAANCQLAALEAFVRPQRRNPSDWIHMTITPSAWCCAPEVLKVGGASGERTVGR